MDRVSAMIRSPSWGRPMTQAVSRRRSSTRPPGVALACISSRDGSMPQRLRRPPVPADVCRANALLEPRITLLVQLCLQRGTHGATNSLWMRIRYALPTALLTGMEQLNEQWMTAVVDALSDLQAARVAQGAVLEAMVASHPSPVLLMRCWDRLSSSLIATASQHKAASTMAKPIEAYTLEQLAAWTDRMERCFPQARGQS
ncbi:hypothetical protein CPBF367_34340 [Xanthomonas arboricola pv. juglandis]|nr:hypothetical protein CPBF367_34340 [Xanthomonas arboricola pv. juglandis]